MSDPAPDAGLFDGVFAAGPIREVLSDTAWLQAMLDFEAALVHAQADVGLIPHRHATAISAQCRAEFYDAGEIGAAAVKIGNPAGPLVRALTARVAGEAAGYVHFGATSQDVMDTAAMLLARRGLDVVAADVEACADLLAELAEQHVDTVQAGRTLLQQALPVTFGLTAAGWLSGMDAAADVLATQRGTFGVQLGGAAGTLASLGEHGPDVLSGIAARLALAEPVLPWQTERSRITSLATTLGAVSGTVAKIARDIVLLAQTEVAEVAEIAAAGTAGGSSTMPHKRNPVAAVSAAAAAAQAPGLVSTVLSASAHEHQRAAGNWHAEWQPLAGLLRGTGAAARWLRTSLQRLHVDPARMRANLELTGGLLLAERVTSELVTAHGVGRAEAHDAVAACCASASPDTFAAALAGDPLIGGHLDRERITALLDPSGYLGSATAFVERALIHHHRKRSEE